jgi:hypothetical protein
VFRSKQNRSFGKIKNRTIGFDHFGESALGFQERADGEGRERSSQPLVLLHTVTVPAALRLFLPHLPAGLHKTALAYVWQNVAAVAAVYADEKPSESEDWHTHEESVIIERSIEPDDPHALKFTEACIREYRLNPRAVYLAAAEDGRPDWIGPRDGALPNAMRPEWSSDERGAPQVWHELVITV